MRILIADDDFVFRCAVETALTGWGYEVVNVPDGAAAWQVLQGNDPPQLALLDWVMPGMDGVEVCRRVRTTPQAESIFLILLTGRRNQEDVVAGLEGGADEYITKPVELAELRARIQAGLRIVTLQNSLARRVQDLESALTQVKQLQGLLPICSWCKKIRDDQNYWQQVEDYLGTHADLHFTHGICPECLDRVVQPELQRIDAAQPAKKPS